MARCVTVLGTPKQQIKVVMRWQWQGWKCVQKIIFSKSEGLKEKSSSSSDQTRQTERSNVKMSSSSVHEKGKVRSEQCHGRQTFDSASTSGASLNESERGNVQERRWPWPAKCRCRRRLKRWRKRVLHSCLRLLYSSFSFTSVLQPPWVEHTKTRQDDGVVVANERMSLFFLTAIQRKATGKAVKTRPESVALKSQKTATSTVQKKV